MPVGAFRALGQILDRLNECSCILDTLAITMIQGMQSCVQLAGWSLCGSHGQLWLGSRFSFRSGLVLSMLAPVQALCQHAAVQMICKTPDTSWS